MKNNYIYKESSLDKVFYFNINYTCNNKCVFCISHNVSGKKREIPKDEILNRLSKKSVGEGSYLIVNGGEPTLHSEFYQIINEISKLNLTVKIYSNGVKIDTNKILNKKIEFIIPIHGSEIKHDHLTRRAGSYKNTLKSLRSLSVASIPFSIKFILSQEMIDDKFDIMNFLVKNKLNVKEIYLSRMNNSKVANKNNYTIPKSEDLIRYLKLQYKNLKLDYKIKFIDIPRCFLADLNIDDFNVINIKQKEEFYFNDVERNMVSDVYGKERFCFDTCHDCKFSAECDLMSVSYYVLSSNRNKMELQPE